MAMSKSTERIINRAIQTMGSRLAVADELGITRQAMHQWQKIPARHVLALESMSGVSRYEMRPDVFGRVPPRPSARSELRAAG